MGRLTRQTQLERVSREEVLSGVLEVSYLVARVLSLLLSEALRLAH
jgi:hypothetical protein